MTPLQLQYTGLGFAAALVAFLMVAYFVGSKGSIQQWAILRFLCSLCGAFSGALITGSALFNLDQTWGSGKLAFSGTAGFALFGVVWYGFRQVAERPPDRFGVSIPDGWNFEQAARTIAKNDTSTITFSGFLPTELAAVLSPQMLETDSVADALGALGQLVAPPNKVRDYVVEFTKPTYSLRVKS